MHESRLSPVFRKKGPKRQHVDPVVSATTHKQKVRIYDMVNIPRSLFDPPCKIPRVKKEVLLPFNEPSSPESPEVGREEELPFNEPSSPESPGVGREEELPFNEPSSPESPGVGREEEFPFNESSSPESPGVGREEEFPFNEPSSPESPGVGREEEFPFNELSSPESPGVGREEEFPFNEPSSPESPGVGREEELPFNEPSSLSVGLNQLLVIPNEPEPGVYQGKSEWLVHEDFGILQVVQDLQGFPLNLTTPMPALTPNWDLSADFVNCINRVYRSASLCKNRYEDVIMLREGNILYETNLMKQTEGIYKTKYNLPMNTSHLYQHDNNLSLTSILNTRVKSTQEMAQKRKMCERQSCLETYKGPEMVSGPKKELSDKGINYDEPLNPMQIASNRAQRIAREK